ncbi:MAG TPA: FAD:protein FMN transferase [Gemmataceae bacterium]|jgi:thiamine biosynthesis lipoprotein|nr:FAD:protein FMN transferase [Gemmataceae bacterium]
MSLGFFSSMNRRELLQSSEMLQTAGQLLAPWLDLIPTSSAGESEFTLLRLSHRAMATLFEVMFPFEQPRAAELASEIFEEIEHLEAQMTVYRDDSEVSLLNQRAFERPVVVGERLFELFSLAAQLNAETSGAFDITSGPLIKGWGFFRRQGRVPTPQERQEALLRVGMKWVELNPQDRSVRFRKPGMEINLGSIGKGYALDRAAELLRRQHVASALLHGGGSSVVAIGRQPNSPRGWPVGIRHPWREGESLGTIYLQDRALGTSAATYQHLEYNHRKLGHLLDPRSGWPAEGIASASALAPTAAQADALATAFFVLGIEKTNLYCQAHPGIGAILLPEGEQAQPIAIGLRPEDWAAKKPNPPAPLP